MINILYGIYLYYYVFIKIQLRYVFMQYMVRIFQPKI